MCVMEKVIVSLRTLVCVQVGIEVTIALWQFAQASIIQIAKFVPIETVLVLPQIHAPVSKVTVELTVRFLFAST